MSKWSVSAWMPSRISGRDLFDLTVVALFFACLILLQACSATLPAQPTIPPLPKSIKEPPRPFPNPPGTQP